MNPMFRTVLSSWPSNGWLLALLVISGGFYCRGWNHLRSSDPLRWRLRKPAAFVGGLATIYVALASPIETFSSFLLCVHMTQHMLLMMVAAPLIWLGAPLLPMLWGVPRPVRTHWLAPLVRSRTVRRGLARISRPVWSFSIFIAVTWIWHVPVTYELALRSPTWHYVQHVCFLAGALLFWYAVVQPYPARPAWSAWLLLPYLLVADVQNTLLSALLTFSAKPLYPYYVDMPRMAGLSARQDQSIAGSIMWVVGSLAFLAPLCWIGIRLLYGNRQSRAFNSLQSANVPPLRLPVRCRRAFDLLHLPVVGRFLRWRHARLAVQIPVSILAIAIIVDGLMGPDVGAMNLAGVLPWIHWRGLVVLGLLVVGNVFCMGCPFLLPRTLARRVLPQGRSWPRWLRNKWLAVFLLGLFLWSYEAFSLWDSPRWTAWIAVGYFALAFAVDGVFRGASFCKYVCPIGQFNFVQSLVSPLEVKVREPDVCHTCATQECIRGSASGIPGCELKLYQPRKHGNLDCTFCLDCVHACPHDNVGVLAVTPAAGLWEDSLRSGIGRFSRRTDLAALVLVLVFGAFANAAGMVGPVVGWENRITVAWGLQSSLPVISLFYVCTLVVLPLITVYAAAAIGRRWSGDSTTRLVVATRYTFALVPLGFAMWLSHYSFHFVTSYGTIIPTTQRFAEASLGWPVFGEPLWSNSCCRAPADWLPQAEIIALQCGLLLSLFVGYRIALVHAAGPVQALRTLSPWAVLMVLLFAAGVWILLQPMQMRGTI